MCWTHFIFSVPDVESAISPRSLYQLLGALAQTPPAWPALSQLLAGVLTASASQLPLLQRTPLGYTELPHTPTSGAHGHRLPEVGDKPVTNSAAQFVHGSQYRTRLELASS